MATLEVTLPTTASSHHPPLGFINSNHSLSETMMSNIRTLMVVSLPSINKFTVQESPRNSQHVDDLLKKEARFIVHAEMFGLFLTVHSLPRIAKAIRVFTSDL